MRTSDASRRTPGSHHSRLNQRTFLTDGRDVFWFTWTGSRIQRTLMAFARGNAGFKVHDDEIALVSKTQLKKTCVRCCRRFWNIYHRPMLWPLPIVHKAQEKYEHFLSNELQAIVFGRNSLDVHGAHSLLIAQLAS